MFQENLSMEIIEQQLVPVIKIFEENVIPNQVELLANNSYSLNYAWMYSFEKRLKYKIEDLLGYKLIYSQEKVLFGVGGVVSEGISNAFAHGHKKNIDLAILVWICVSQKGLGFTIWDQGAGFDFDTILKRCKKGESFFKIAGNGFSLLNASAEFSACYQKNGTQLCILFPLNNG